MERHRLTSGRWFCCLEAQLWHPFVLPLLCAERERERERAAAAELPQTVCCGGSSARRTGGRLELVGASMNEANEANQWAAGSCNSLVSSDAQ